MNSSVSYTNTDNDAHTLPFTFTNDDSDPVWTTGSSPIYPWTLSPGFDVVASIPWYLLTLGTILANGITLFVFTKEKKLRSHVNYYVMNLALADLCVGIFVMPVYAVVVMLEWYWPIFGFYGCKVFQGIGYSLVTVSNLTVLVISGDRFYAVVSPLNYFKNRSKKVAIFVNGFCWILAFGIWIPFNTIWPIWRAKPPLLHTICGPDYGQTFLGTIVATCILLWCPILLLIIFNTTLYLKIIKRGPLSVGKSFQDESHANKSENVNSTTNATSLAHDSHSDYNYHNNPTFVQEDSTPESDQGIGTGGIWLGSGDVNVDKETYRLNDLQGAVCVVEKMNNLNILKNGWPTSDFVDGIHRLPGQNTDTTFAPDTTRSRRGSRLDANSHHEVKLSSTQKESSKESLTAFRILSAIVLSYILSWIMFGVVVVTISVCVKINNVKCTSSTVDLIAMYLSLSNSLINPVCYVIVQPHFRRSVAKLFCK